MAQQQHRDSKRHIAHNRCKKQTNPALSLWKLPVVVSLILDDFASVALPSSSTTSLGPSINDVDNWEGEGSKIDQNCLWIVLKNCQRGGGGVKNPKKLPTSFMDGPIPCDDKIINLPSLLFSPPFPPLCVEMGF